MVLTQERAKELFDYRPEDGALVRKTTASNNAMAGTVAGSPAVNDYLRVCVAGKFYYNHRLVWLYHHGYMPENGLDHIDRNRTNNRIENLREVGCVCNSRNSGNKRNNTSGVKGVMWFKAGKTWASRVKVNFKGYAIGYHKDFLEAVCHRLAAEQALDWPGCDSCSPAYQYVKKHIPGVK